jgi:hypothetical protein
LPDEKHERKYIMSDDTQNTTKSAPVAKLKVRRAKGAIWARVADDRTFFEATFQVGYPDRDGNWKNGHSYNLANLLAHRVVVDQAIDQLLALEAADVSDTAETVESE